LDTENCTDARYVITVKAKVKQLLMRAVLRINSDRPL
jgi:hypothetical protein